MRRNNLHSHELYTIYSAGDMARRTDGRRGPKMLDARTVNEALDDPDEVDGRHQASPREPLYLSGTSIPRIFLKIYVQQRTFIGSR
ncbi:jg16942 [Pararge aegeria aegeria]|uniref:Jg16942 protein n=1 Tax=Pararge aegeria aegeria TaxID=348720 RepID=A0A8S4SDC6_9NEOP|nr:jg16942 [Pararge aegeria aegeria]